MTRDFIGAWADALLPLPRAQAIGALGVLVNAWNRQKPDLLSTADEVAAALSSRAARGPGSVQRRRRHVGWGIYASSDWADVMKRVSPAVAAQGWAKFTGLRESLDIHAVSQYMNDQEAVATYKWLADALWHDKKIRSVTFARWLNTKVRDERRAARNAWHWPLRLGFLPDEASRSLLDAFYSAPGSGWVQRLATAVDLEGTGQSCDLLLSPLGLIETRRRLQEFKVSATAILMLGRGPIDTMDCAIASQELLAAANAAALAFFPGKPWIDTVTGLILHISHDLPFNAALSEAARNSTEAPLIIAESAFINRNRISQLGAYWTRRLEFRQESSFADRMKNLVGDDFLSENGPASGLVELAREADPEAPEARFLKAKSWFVERSVQSKRQDEEERSGTDFILRPAGGFLAQQWHVLVVNIAPLAAGESSELPALDLSGIDWVEERQKLTIAITAPECIVHPLPVAVGSGTDLIVVDLVAAALRDVDFATLEEGRTRRDDDRRETSDAAAANITIQATGASSAAVFLLKMHAGAKLKARVLAVHANRILQTALIDCPMLTERSGDGDDPKIELLPEGMIRSSLQELNERRVFDVAILTNDSLTGDAQTTIVADDRVVLRNLDEVKQMAANISQRLEKIVEEPETFTQPDSEALRTLLINLAHEGVLLRDAFFDAGLTEVSKRNPARLQVVTAKPDQVLPLEMIYDGYAPNRKSAAICKSQREALERGSCGDCPNRSASSHVCAMRFWGLQKVIERQMYSERAPEKDYVATASPSPKLERIGRAATRLFASSARAGEFDPTAITKLQARLGSGDGAELLGAKDWDEWRLRVQERSPGLLAMLPHVDVSTAGDVLEIGENETITNAEIDERVVGSISKVIVLLLGCETADARVRYANFIGRFRRAKAAIVVGTITPVRGRHAAPMAEMLVEHLDRFWSEPSKVVTMGDVMMIVRRRFMEAGLPTGLALVAFGDADWLLGKE